MTTYVQFIPSITQVFTIQPTLAGVGYTLTVTWSLAGQRWVMNLFSTNGILVLSQAFVGSPPNYDINLVAGYLPGASLVFRQGTQTIEYS